MEGADMEEHLTILPPPPPAWMTLRAATTGLVGRAVAAIVRVVTTIVRLARSRAARPEVTLSSILEGIDGERGCLQLHAGGGAPPSGAAERPTRVEITRPRAPSRPASARGRRGARRASRGSGPPGTDRPSRLPSAPAPS